MNDGLLFQFAGFCYWEQQHQQLNSNSLQIGAAYLEAYSVSTVKGKTQYNA